MTTTITGLDVRQPAVVTHSGTLRHVGRVERVVALAAAAVIAVHVLDDSFVQPEPGTSAADHLLSGLVTLATLVLAAVAYPRLRAGARAVAALLLGAFAVAASAEGVWATWHEGPTGDDYTGLLTAVAGPVLICLGAVTLWRSRRTADGLARRYLRRLLVGIGALVVCFTTVLPVGAAYVITHVHLGASTVADIGIPYEDVTLTTDGGLALRAWYVPSTNGAAVIAIPGRTGPKRHALMLARHGYGVLLLDHSGSASSPGDPNLLGWNRSADVHAAVAFLRTRPDVDPGRIGGLGLSVGGETLLQAAAESSDLEAVVSEGAGIRTVGEQWELSGVNRWTGLPAMAVNTAAMAVFSNRMPPASLDDAIGQIAPRPVFLISATRGIGGEELNEVYHAAAGEPKTWWEIPEASHTGGIDARPDEYERRVVGFFDDALLKGRNR